MIKLLFILLISFVIQSCSSVVIEDISIKIFPYKKEDRGKFMEICFDSENFAWYGESPVLNLEISTIDGKKRAAQISFIHFKDLGKFQKCNRKNLFLWFTGHPSRTPKWVSEWLKSLGPDNIEYIITEVKDSREGEIIFYKKFFSKDLNIGKTF